MVTNVGKAEYSIYYCNTDAVHRKYFIPEYTGNSTCITGKAAPCWDLAPVRMKEYEMVQKETINQSKAHFSHSTNKIFQNTAIVNKIR